MKNKEMQLGAMVVAMLVISAMVVPVAMAKKDSGTSKLSDSAVKALLDKFVEEGANADKFFKKLSPEEKAAIIEAGKVSKISTNVIMNEKEVSIAGITCNSPRVVVTAYGYIGNKLWSYIQQIDRCFDGSKITQVSRIRLGQSYMPTWQFVGHIDSTVSGGVGESYYRSYTQGKFTNCITNLCFDEKNPYVDMIVYGNGGFWKNSGGS